MYNWDSSWNWSTKSLSSPSLLVLFPQLFHFLITVLCACHICVWRLWLKTFSISSVQFLQSVSPLSVLSCVYAFCTLRLSSFHYDDHACVLLCLHLSTYFATSSSSFRNFLTGKFLSEEFIKIAYSPPSSRYNALLRCAMKTQPCFMNGRPSVSCMEGGIRFTMG